MHIGEFCSVLSTLFRPTYPLLATSAQSWIACPALKAVQWNKSDGIILQQKYSPTAAAVSGTWLRMESHCRVPGLILIRDGRSDGYGGAAVLIRKHTSFSSVGTLTYDDGLQAVTVKVEGITFLSLYITSSSEYF
ncbi:hypothetical protein EVAR_56323_1 [Eumeta japonica]|uniref:Uncharacterized protein n=1 Tax=Eumeta variegata TaxID=151549 RepID=A0A4C1YF84_EUMVA|nr:hypothetical protein EVAR_56323_1 [Eumeta japonica]